MKYDLKKPIFELSGKPINDGTKDLMMNTQLAGMLGNSSSPGEATTVKRYEWAKALYAGEVIDLDSTDQKGIREFIGSSAQPNTIKAQMLLEMDLQEKEKKK